LATENVRQRMIERTVVLLARNGLEGTSFSRVLEESGAPRGSLYHHFPGGKDELVLEAIALSGRQAMAVLDRLAGRPAAEVAAAFIALWRQVLTRSDFGAGCAVAAVTVAAQTPALRDRAGEIFRAWRLRLSELLAAGGVPAERAPVIAAALISACEGGVILARAERSLEPFEMVTGAQLQSIAEAARR
jgi:TetR/AcrR family transcriptional repressor of lmrAB and yxaGH operons